MLFVHSADWQIGKVFKHFGPKEETLRQARLSAIERLGNLATDHGARHILVAGDVYDSEAPSPVTLRAPIERMKAYSEIHWHLLPGNHDPHRPEGVWDRLAQIGLPPNIHLHLTPAPYALEPHAFLLPAPLTRKTETQDLSEWMDAALTPAGALRIGLAHGCVTNFGSEGEATNPIRPDRPKSARLDYLALGDWHRTLQIGPAAWYAGTPEADRAGSQEQGTALLVELAGPGAPALVTPVVTGTYRWTTRTEHLTSGAELPDLEKRLRAESDLPRVILRLRLEGALPIAAFAELQHRLIDLEAALFHLTVDQSGLATRPTEGDLEAIDFDGVLRRCADRLRSLGDDGALDVRRRAEEALVELYLRVADAQHDAQHKDAA
jgi:DNA repair exonuclease SbcCD nuclease subunit